MLGGRNREIGVIELSVDRNFGWFYNLASLRVTHMGERVPLLYAAFVSIGCITRSDLLG